MIFLTTDEIIVLHEKLLNKTADIINNTASQETDILQIKDDDGNIAEYTLKSGEKVTFNINITMIAGSNPTIGNSVVVK